MTRPNMIKNGRLRLGLPDDPAEHEAHRAASRVVRGGTASVVAAGPVGETGTIAPSVRRRIARACRGGRPLAEVDRVPMERAFGADLRRVRLHTGAQAGELCRALDARAFTVGRHIFLDSEYRPGSASTGELLAHELAHVLQRQSTVVRRFILGAYGKQETVDTMLVRVKGHDNLYDDALNAGMTDQEIRDLVRAYIDAPTQYTHADVYTELRRQVNDRAFHEDIPAGINGVRLQQKDLGAVGTAQAFAAVVTDTVLDLHPGQLVFRATLGAQLDQTEVGNWTLGMVQTVLSASRVVCLRRLDQSVRTVTMTLAAPHNDRRGAAGPWYDNYRSSSHLAAGYQDADVLLDDQPGFRLDKAADEQVENITGTDMFKTWLVLRRDADGWMSFLYSWEWQIDYSTGGGVVTSGAEAWWPDGADAVLTGPRAGDAVVIT